ncbi:hypothetical protein Goshw_024296 [Gossypium schwendimanii]|uniref:Uncharacterized protein n=1 Tax=Gossypium schwendimanii TaxID=34291 RepID=A0A7J9LCN0_GOSSC|nr:hypothetical protein [Gossypium schwendimanii]
MSLNPIEAGLGEGLPSNMINHDEANVVDIHSSDAWATWRMDLANQMFYEWKKSGKDATLVSYMVDLQNVGTFNADTRFKTDYLNELERMLEKVLPHAMLKAKPNIESSFSYYDQPTVIYAKDRAIGKDAQTVSDIIEEIDVEDVATVNTHEERNYFHGYEADVSLDEIDLSATQPQPSRNQDDSTFSKMKKDF